MNFDLLMQPPSRQMDIGKTQSFETKDKPRMTSRGNSCDRKADLRILQVHHFRYPHVRGGVDRVVAELVDALGGRSCVLFEVAGWEERRLTRRVERDVTVYRRRLRTPGQGHGVLRKAYRMFEQSVTVLRLIRILRRERIDLIHVHTLQDYHWYFIALSKIGICPYVVTLHRAETLEYASRSRKQQSRWAQVLAKARRVTAVSATLADLAVERLPVERRPAVVHNGISDPAQRVGRSHNAGSSRPYAVCVGTLKSYKGHDIAISAWSKLSELGQDIELLIAGEGELRDTLLTQIDQGDCVGKVRLLGAVSHDAVLDLVAGATLFIMPSRNEGLGLALIEAAALAKPVIASDIPVFREVITHNATGILFPPENAEALAQKVAQLLDSPADAERLATAARARFLEAFSRDGMASRYRDVYRAALARSVTARQSARTGS